MAFGGETGLWVQPKGLRSVYLAWVGEGVRIPRSRATNDCIYHGGGEPNGPVSARGAVVRVAPLRPARPNGAVKPDNVISEARRLREEGLIKAWASVIIPTSLAGVGIAASVKFTIIVLFLVWR